MGTTVRGDGDRMSPAGPGAGGPHISVSGDSRKRGESPEAAAPPAAAPMSNAVTMRPAETWTILSPRFRCATRPINLRPARPQSPEADLRDGFADCPALVSCRPLRKGQDD